MSHRFTRAIVRLPGGELADGLTRVDLGRADVALALAQHAAYRDALRACGLDVTVLLSGCGHMPLMAQPKQVAEAVVSFVGSDPA